MIYGITNIMLSLNILSPFLAGYMIPGKPIGVMIFKVYSTIVLGQAQTFSQDLKLAHYMKIPPRTAFIAQLVATVWASIVQVAVMNWTLGKYVLRIYPFKINVADEYPNPKHTRRLLTYTSEPLYLSQWPYFLFQQHRLGRHRT